MKLLPFHKEWASQIQEWNIDPCYARFWSGIQKHLTFEDCEHLPQFLDAEIFYLLAATNETFGMISLSDEPYGVVKFGILIDKNFWNQKLGAEALSQIGTYCKNVKGSRMLMTQAYVTDEASNKELVKQDYKLIGRIDKYCHINGQYEDVNLYYKGV